MKGISWYGLFALIVPLVLVLYVGDGEVEALPGRKNRQKNNDGNGWFDSNKNKNNNQGWGSNTGAGYKKKGGTMKTLKKAAVIGNM